MFERRSRQEMIGFTRAEGGASFTVTEGFRGIELECDQTGHAFDVSCMDTELELDDWIVCRRGEDGSVACDIRRLTRAKGEAATRKRIRTVTL